MYEKMHQRLLELDANGAEASIRRLTTKLNVSIKAIDAIAREIHKVRDKELQPQVSELIYGSAIGKQELKLQLMWQNALEYLHFYCDPPLCHRDIKSSNILLDENFIGKVADVGLANASKDGSICFEPVNTEIRGTPGYMDPEYVVTQELTEKSDIYSYGVVLLELITSRRAIHDNRNLVEACQSLLTSSSRHRELVYPAIGDSFDLEQLQTVVTVIKWCTQREGRGGPGHQLSRYYSFYTSVPTLCMMVLSKQWKMKEAGLVMVGCIEETQTFKVGMVEV